MPIEVKKQNISASFWPTKLQEKIIRKCEVPISGHCKDLLSEFSGRLRLTRVIIETGDTLSKVSLKNLGTPSRWREIRSLNRPYGDCSLPSIDPHDGESCLPIKAGLQLFLPVQ